VWILRFFRIHFQRKNDIVAIVERTMWMLEVLFTVWKILIKDLYVNPQWKQFLFMKHKVYWQKLKVHTYIHTYNLADNVCLQVSIIILYG
jgi:hypothetical protein